MGDVRVVGWVTARTEVAASTRRRVSWKVERRSGQWVWKCEMSITASCSPVCELVCRETMLSTSVRIEDRREGDERMYDNCQNEVGIEFVVARNRVLISKFAMSFAENPHFWQEASRDRINLLAPRWWFSA